MKIRTPAIALIASASLLTSVLNFEGFKEEAYIPVKGDVPTVGYGSTHRDDGSPVQMGDKITEPEAREKAIREIRQVYEAGLKRCIADVPLTQGEYDSLVDLSYNIGVAKVCKSGMVRNFKAGNYKAGCEFILQYRFSNGVDCFLPQNKKRCGGIKDRRMWEYETCLELPLTVEKTWER